MPAPYSTGVSIIDTKADTNWKIVGTGDVNGNGKADLIWRNSTTERVAVTMTNALNQTTDTVIYTESNKDWRIMALLVLWLISRKRQTSHTYFTHSRPRGGFFMPNKGEHYGYRRQRITGHD